MQKKVKTKKNADILSTGVSTELATQDEGMTLVSIVLLIVIAFLQKSIIRQKIFN